MASSEDTEITLGTGKLLVLFFALVGGFALFFAFGYSLGRKSEPAIAAASAASPQVAPNTNKASSGSGAAGAAAAPMTFYKSVEQKDANPQLTPAADAKTDTAAAPASASPGPAQTTPANPSDPTLTLPTAGYFVQVAAVTKQEDAEALVDALKNKQYPAFVAPQSSDKFFRVQVGPFSDIKDAEAMRTRLVGDGYSPIVKK
jgi:cell division septation protein DedD